MTWTGSKPPKAGVVVMNEERWAKYTYELLDGTKCEGFITIHKVGGKCYLEVFPGEKTSWTKKWNANPQNTEKFTRKERLIEHLGEHGFAQWKERYVVANFPEVKNNYCIVRDYTIKNKYQLAGMEVLWPDENGKFPKWRALQEQAKKK